MLTRITIRDFAIIDTLDIELSEGLSVITGETGAGKSIVLDGLGLCLGDRADTSMVPEGATRSEVMVTFDLTDNPQAQQWLSAEALDDEEHCLIRRVIHQNGRSQASINGRPVTRSQLESLSSLLVGIHGQHAHQQLLKPAIQRRTLDNYADHTRALDNVGSVYRQLQSVIAEIEQLGGGEDQADRKALLRYQLEELDGCALTPAAYAELNQEQKRLASAGELIETCQHVLETLYDSDTAVHTMLASAQRQLSAHEGSDPAIAEANELFANAMVQTQEGCQQLRHFADGLEIDPQRLSEVDQKLSQLSDLARKHQTDPEELVAVADRIRSTLEALESADSRLTELAEKKAQLSAEYRKASADLSASRQKAAERLSAEVNTLLGELGMPGAALLIGVAYNPDSAPTQHGQDEVQFDVRTNPDQTAGPIQRVASGGELSRIGLAIEVATARTAEIPCLIFDEADSGIGGAIAEVVGTKLRLLAQHHQVICITHLAQVAAQGHTQLQVEKQHQQGRTRTLMRILDEKERLEEIARMLGGVEITPATRDHAKEMLTRAE